MLNAYLPPVSNDASDSHASVGDPKSRGVSGPSSTVASAPASPSAGSVGYDASVYDAGEPDSVGGLSRFRPVSQGKVLLLLNQLAVMTHNGVEIAEALEIAVDGCEDPRLRQSVQRIATAVSGGRTISHAFRCYGEFFPKTLAPMLAAAEATGDVPQTLLKVCKRMRGEIQMRATILGALIYPLILVGASIVVMSALIIGVLPQFKKVFESLGKPVPPSTQILMTFGDFCRASWPVILVAMIGSVVGVALIRNTSLIRRPIARLFMYGPMIRGAYRPLMAGRIFRTLAAIVGGGVPMLEAVRLTRRTTRDLYWEDLLDTVESDLIDGKTMTGAFTAFDFLPTEATQMVFTAERTGRVAEVLEDIGLFYEEEAGRKIRRLIVALEPVIILFMGVIVAAIVMSVMLPLLDVSSAR